MSEIFLGFKMLLRKSGTASTILSIALLVAIIASMNAVANYIAIQTQILSSLVPAGGTYLIHSQNSTGLIHSKISPELATSINNTGLTSHINNPNSKGLCSNQRFNRHLRLSEV